MNMSPMFIYIVSGLGVAAMNSPVSWSRYSRPWWESWNRNVKELYNQRENQLNYSFQELKSDHTSNPYERPTATGRPCLGPSPDNGGDEADSYHPCVIPSHNPPPRP